MAGGTRGASTSSDHWRQLHSPPSFKAVIFGEDKEKELAAAKAVEEALWDLWGKMLKAAEAAVLSQFPS